MCRKHVIILAALALNLHHGRSSEQCAFVTHSLITHGWKEKLGVIVVL